MPRCRLALLLLVLLPARVTAQAITFATPPTGLQAAYAMSTGADSSGNGRTGVLLNTTTVAGKYDQGQRFSGQGRMTIPSFNVGAAFTIEAWVYLEQLTRDTRAAPSSGWQAIVFKAGNTTADADTFFLAESGQFFTAGFLPAGGGSIVQILSPTRTTINAWHSVAATYTGTTLALVVDGVQVSAASATGAVVPSTAPIEVGGSSLHAGSLNGVIDDVRIYSRALTLQEIAIDMATPIDTAREDVVSWQMDVWKGAPTTGAMVAHGEFLKTTALCNLPPLPVAPPAPVINPTKARLADPTVPMRECELVIQTLIESVPVGIGYTSTLLAKGSTTQSDRSSASNAFDRVAEATPPVVPGTPVVR